MSKTYFDNLKLIRGRKSLINMDTQYIEEDNRQEDDLLYNHEESQRNVTGNSNKIYPDLSDSLSEVETFSSSDYIKSNTVIDYENQNCRVRNYGGSCPPSPKATPPKKVPLRGTPAERLPGKITPQRQRISPPQHESQSFVFGEWFWYVISLLALAFFVVSAFYGGKLTFWSFVKSESWGHPTKPVICTEFTALNYEFPQQSDKFWAYLKSGVERVANKRPTKPSTFMLLHETDVDIQLLLSKIIEATQICLGTKNHSPIHLKATALKAPEYLSDYGRVISHFKSALSDSGIMVVEKFNEVPPYVAQAFHTICDGETPYVPRSIIYLTMPVKRITSQDNPFKVAENQLTTLWGSSLKDNVLGPLLYRVTDVTLHIERND